MRFYSWNKINIKAGLCTKRICWSFFFCSFNGRFKFVVNKSPCVSVSFCQRFIYEFEGYKTDRFRSMTKIIRNLVFLLLFANNRISFKSFSPARLCFRSRYLSCSSSDLGSLLHFFILIHGRGGEVHRISFMVYFTSIRKVIFLISFYNKYV